MKKPTDKQIAAEIAALEKCKEYAPARTMFGNDNHAKIDRQIEFLRGDIDIEAPEWDDFSEDEQSAIMEAQSWQDGDSDESLAAGWDIFKPKKAKSSAERSESPTRPLSAEQKHNEAQ